MCKMFAISLDREIDVSQTIGGMLGMYARMNHDGFGYAYTHNGEILLFKTEQSGMKFLVDSKEKISGIRTRALIGHFRLATSNVTYDNTHPFINEDRTIAMAHNGTISGFEPVKKKLIAHSHRFTSSTVDSEIMLHLFEEHGKFCVSKLQEIYGVTGWVNLLFIKEDDTIVGISDGSLYLTKIEEGYILSSTELLPTSEEIKQGIAITLKDGHVVDRRRVFSRVEVREFDSTVRPMTYSSFKGEKKKKSKYKGAHQTGFGVINDDPDDLWQTE
jgi:glucosamine 6-phosphate synthetase-like amidotransferase/phosphosugar isomerase protein